jgi:IS605 OrfB family transposase
MQLVEKHIIKKNDKNWKQVDYLSFISKNLYNQAIYYIKQNYKETGKFLRYYDIEKYFRLNDLKENENYKLLPNNTSQQILMLLDKNLKSFFALLKLWKKDKKSLNGCPKFPKYKDKLKGRNILIFTKNQFNIKDGCLNFPKKTKLNNIKTKVNLKDAQQVRIVPQSSCYTIEIIYNFEEVNYELNKDNYLSIDLGVNNLCAIATNQPGLKPLLINGKPLKSINQYANKLIAKEQNQLKKNHNKYSSKNLEKIRLKRQNKISFYLHNVSKYIIQYCVNNDIKNIVIGHNKEWKQECNIGKRNNQNFVQIPFNTLIQQVQYKAKMVGINVIITEESYTSKVDHLAFEEMKHQENYLGKRIKRGLFSSSKKLLLNADINAAIGILRKVIGNDFINQLNRGCVTQPLKVLPL